MARHTKEALESLRAIPLFSGVKGEDLERIADLLIERRFPKHKTIVEEGLPGDYMYVICEGRVQVSKLSDDGREKILEFFEKGAFFGEMSLLDDAPRSASVRALTDTRILALSRSDFLAVMRRSPDVAMAVVQELARRLRVHRSARELALVPAREGAHAGAAPAAGQGRVRPRRPPHHAGRHPPADRGHGRHLARDGHPGAQGAQAGGLARAGGQALRGARCRRGVAPRPTRSSAPRAPISPRMGVGDADFAAQVWEHSTSGICAVDASGSLVMINAAARRTLGGSCASAPLGMPCEQALADYPTLARLLREALAGRPALSRAELCADARRRRAPRARLVADHAPRRRRARSAAPRVVFRDLAPIERSGERERLQQRLAALGEMAAGLAHELRNPLAGMEVLAGLLQRRLARRSRRARRSWSTCADSCASSPAP